jgi:hypothetical protein
MLDAREYLDMKQRRAQDLLGVSVRFLLCNISLPFLS